MLMLLVLAIFGGAAFPITSALADDRFLPWGTPMEPLPGNSNPDYKPVCDHYIEGEHECSDYTKSYCDQFPGLNNCFPLWISDPQRKNPHYLVVTETPFSSGRSHGVVRCMVEPQGNYVVACWFVPRPGAPGLDETIPLDVLNEFCYDWWLSPGDDFCGGQLPIYKLWERMPRCYHNPITGGCQEYSLSEAQM